MSSLGRGLILFVVTAAFAFSGCASFGRVHSHIDQETTADLLIRDGAGRVRVFCENGATVFEYRDSRITFSGHEGVRGDLGSAAGDLVIGAVRFTYDGDGARWAGDSGAGAFEFTTRHAAVIDQHGAATDEMRPAAR